MAITFTNLSELNKYIQAQINSALADEVKTEVVETVEAVGLKEVYGAYPEPKMYERRYGSGDSLLDPENFDGQVDNGVLTVKSTASPNYSYHGDQDYTVKSLAELVEHGNGYEGQLYSFPTSEKNGDKPNRAYKRPRPFMAKTIEELAQRDTLKDALKKGLKRRGLAVK